MKIQQLMRQAEKLVRDNSPAILTALGVSGTLTTAYLTGKASWQAAYVLSEDTPPELPIKEKVIVVWRLYIPASISGALTVTCIIAAARVGSRRTAAITAAYSITEKAFVEYKDKVAEQLGERKEKSLRDSIAQDRITANPPSKELVIISGKVLCFDDHSGRYFESDAETLRKAENEVNGKLYREMWVSLSDFYYMIGLPSTGYSSELGWNVEKPLKIDFSTVLSPDEKPCLAFKFNYIKPI